MGKELIKAKNENDEEAKEYLKFIHDSVKDGSYFKDALNWYSFRYITPICDRTILIFGALIAVVVLYCLEELVASSYNLVLEKPIYIASKDTSKYFPNLVDLKPREGEEKYDHNIKNIDEAIAKYLLKNYVKERESFDYSKGKAEIVTRKFDHIKNTSSESELREFKLLMSRDNPDSPITKFGKNFTKDVKFESLKFVRKEKVGFKEKAIDYLVEEIPTQAEVRFVATTTHTISENNVKKESVRYIAKISFDFEGVQVGQKGRLGFRVNRYRLFKVR